MAYIPKKDYTIYHLLGLLILVALLGNFLDGHRRAKNRVTMGVSK